MRKLIINYGSTSSLSSGEKEMDRIYHLVKATEGQDDTWLRYFDQYHELAFSVFDYSQIDTIFYKRELILTSTGNYTLLVNDAGSLKTLYNKLFALRFILESYIQYLEELKTRSINTLHFLKQEYHLK